MNKQEDGGRGGGEGVTITYLFVFHIMCRVKHALYIKMLVNTCSLVFNLFRHLTYDFMTVNIIGQ